MQFFPMNEEFPVSAGHKLALIKSLPFVHTARRYYRLDGLVRSSDRPRRGRRRPWRRSRKDDQTGLSRGSKSRNKVSVGEPAEGSLPSARAAETGARPERRVRPSDCQSRKTACHGAALGRQAEVRGTPPPRRERQGREPGAPSTGPSGESSGSAPGGRQSARDARGRAEGAGPLPPRRLSPDTQAFRPGTPAAAPGPRHRRPTSPRAAVPARVGRRSPEVGETARGRTDGRGRRCAAPGAEVRTGGRWSAGARGGYPGGPFSSARRLATRDRRPSPRRTGRPVGSLTGRPRGGSARNPGVRPGGAGGREPGALPLSSEEGGPLSPYPAPPFPTPSPPNGRTGYHSSGPLGFPVPATLGGMGGARGRGGRFGRPGPLSLGREVGPGARYTRAPYFRKPSPAAGTPPDRYG